MRRLLLIPIRFYQYAISPMMASRCRYYPTCSAYAVEAIERYGATQGSFLALKRFLRCHPWAEAGYDPVPDQSKSDTGNCCTGKIPDSPNVNQTTTH